MQLRTTKLQRETLYRVAYWTLVTDSLSLTEYSIQIHWLLPNYLYRFIVYYQIFFADSLFLTEYSIQIHCLLTNYLCKLAASCRIVFTLKSLAEYFLQIHSLTEYFLQIHYPLPNIIYRLAVPYPSFFPQIHHLLPNIFYRFHGPLPKVYRLTEYFRRFAVPFANIRGRLTRPYETSPLIYCSLPIILHIFVAPLARDLWHRICPNTETQTASPERYASDLTSPTDITIKHGPNSSCVFLASLTQLVFPVTSRGLWVRAAHGETYAKPIAKVRVEASLWNGNRTWSLESQISTWRRLCGFPDQDVALAVIGAHGIRTPNAWPLGRLQQKLGCYMWAGNAGTVLSRGICRLIVGEGAVFDPRVGTPAWSEGVWPAGADESGDSWVWGWIGG